MKNIMSKKDWLIAIVLFVVSLSGYFIYNNIIQEEKSISVVENKKVETNTTITTNKVFYEKETYKCYEGEYFNTIVKALPATSTIKTIGSNNKSIASVEVNKNLAPNCKNCIMVKVNCNKAGTTRIEASSSTNATTSAKVIVEKKNSDEAVTDIGTISYEKTSYKCTEGESFNTIVKANPTTSTIKTIGSSNKNVVSVEVNKELAVNCKNCINVKVNCKKGGNASITATSSAGASTSSNVEVKEKIIDKGSIAFDKSNYTCREGESFTTMIKSLPGDTYISNYKSTDNNIITIEKNTGLQVNCKNCLMVKVNCKKAGEANVEATSSLGAITKSKVKVEKAEEKIEKGTISYEKASYKCTEGESFSTKVTALPSTNYVKLIGSTNTNNATVEINKELAVNCKNCLMVKVNCKKAGNTNITATSSTGASTSSKLTIDKKEEVVDKGSISYEKETYSCREGESFTTMIKSLPGDTYISNYKSTDNNILTIEKNTGLQVNCKNCLMVKVNCIKAGEANVEATSSLGAVTTSKVRVEEKPKDIKETNKIYYEKENYTCKVGESFNTVVRTTNSESYVKTIGSSDVKKAAIALNTDLKPTCEKCVMVKVTCQKEGIATIRAKATTGETTTSTVTIEKKEEKIVNDTIFYDKSNYTCLEGESFNALLKTSDTRSKVKTIGSTDINKAAIEVNKNDTPACENCIMVKVNCKKAGTANITGKSTTGKTTSSTVTITKKEEEKKEEKIDIGTVSFAKNTYTCTEGESFYTTIKSLPSTTTISKIASSNNNIASIEKDYNTTLNCKNCLSVKVTCKQSGNVRLEGISSTSAVGTTIVNVEKKKDDTKGTTKTSTLETEEVIEDESYNFESLYFEKDKYTCKEGKTFITTVNAINANIKKITSSNKNIASLELTANDNSKCKNCVSIKVYCKKQGNVKLQATSTKGSTTTAIVNVQKEKLTTVVSETEDTYVREFNCYSDKTINTYLDNLSNSVISNLKTGTISDGSVAKVESTGSKISNCKNCLAIKIKCKKTGKLTLKLRSDIAKESERVYTATNKTTTIKSGNYLITK